ncbi:cell division protein ZapD [Amphibiibacter pelophylacis]|uniref:Cell division protein ZapD n=1 Tax=Amphibiibacter pelophylacis TaxID=1799477 RepID=A0ACC6P388_9BURK
MIIYEYPLNESVRTLLRLEHLFDRLSRCVVRDESVDHHLALITLFEVLEVVARAELKAELMRDLDRARSQFSAYRDQPGISQTALDDLLERLTQAFNGLNALPGKIGAGLQQNDFLTNLRSRIAVPGGTCEFDLPAYYRWQNHPPEVRRKDLRAWIGPLLPVARTVQLLLSIIRDTGAPQSVVAVKGQYQQNMPQGKSFTLIRIRVDDQWDIVPEITGHRLLMSVRWMQTEGTGVGKPRVSQQDYPFELTLCT